MGRTTARVKGMEALLWDGDVREVWGRSKAQRAQVRSSTRRKALAELATYPSHQDDRLADDKFRVRRLDFGLGGGLWWCANMWSACG